MVEVVKTGPFNRKPMDKRFVKQVRSDFCNKNAIFGEKKYNFAPDKIYGLLENMKNQHLKVFNCLYFKIYILNI